MLTDPESQQLMALRVSVLTELDASPRLSYLERAELRQRLNAIVGSVNRSVSSTASGIEQLERLRLDVMATEAD